MKLSDPDLVESLGPDDQAQAVVAVDPGSEESAYVRLDVSGRITESGKLTNAKLLDELRGMLTLTDHLAVEMIASYGRPVGAEVFTTCVWIGRFIQAWAGPYSLIYRREVTQFLCGSSTGTNDGVVRQRLIDVYGPGRQVAVGTKRAPGPLYGITADRWQALALALTARGLLYKKDSSAVAV